MQLGRRSSGAVATNAKRTTRAARLFAASMLACVGLSLSTASAADPFLKGRLGKPVVREARGLHTTSGFVANRGQWAAGVLFFARAGGIDATLTRDALVFRPSPPDPGSGRAWPAPLVLRLPGAGDAEVSGEAALPTAYNYFLGSDPSRWASEVPGFERVVYRGVLPGIDVVVRIEKDAAGGAEKFAYDLSLAPFAKLEDFVLDVEGAELLAVTSTGALSLSTAAGVVEQRIGAAWQADGATHTSGDASGDALGDASVGISEKRKPISAAFRLLEGDAGKLRVGFAAAGRDESRAFVLDPTLAWATYVGSIGQEYIRDIEVDAAGATYLLCRTSDSTPTTPGAFQPQWSPIFSAWIGKLSPTGSSLLWATFLGGVDGEEPTSLDVAPDGSVIVFGETWSQDFPVTPGCLQPVAVGVPIKDELFVTHLNASGSALVWSTFYGGPGNEFPGVAAFAPNGDVVISAEPDTALPPATPGAFDTVFNSGPLYTNHDQFLARISADGAHLVFQTYFKSGDVQDMLVDSKDDILFAGVIELSDAPMPVTPGAFKTTTVSINDG